MKKGTDNGGIHEGEEQMMSRRQNDRAMAGVVSEQRKHSTWSSLSS